MWKGYLEQESSQSMREFFAPCRMEYIHSSGHASPNALWQFAEALKPKMLIPVHGASWADHAKNFPNIRQLNNGETLLL
jgi:ribonuclease J